MPYYFMMQRKNYGILKNCHTLLCKQFLSSVINFCLQWSILFSSWSLKNSNVFIFNYFLFINISFYIIINIFFQLLQILPSKGLPVFANVSKENNSYGNSRSIQSDLQCFFVLRMIAIISNNCHIFTFGN